MSTPEPERGRPHGGVRRWTVALIVHLRRQDAAAAMRATRRLSRDSARSRTDRARAGRRSRTGPARRGVAHWKGIRCGRANGSAEKAEAFSPWRRSSGRRGGHVDEESSRRPDRDLPVLCSAALKRGRRLGPDEPGSCSGVRHRGPVLGRVIDIVYRCSTHHFQRRRHRSPGWEVRRDDGAGKLPVIHSDIQRGSSGGDHGYDALRPRSWNKQVQGVCGSRQGLQEVEATSAVRFASEGGRMN